MSNRHLGALIVALYVIIGVAFAGAFAVQNHNDRARRNTAVRESQERTVAVCNAENETRDALRRLARDLTHNPKTLMLVDHELADKNCNALATN